MNGKNSKGHAPPKSPAMAAPATPLSSKHALSAKSVPGSANPIDKKVLKLGSNAVQIIPVGTKEKEAANTSSIMSEKKRGKD